MAPCILDDVPAAVDGSESESEPEEKQKLEPKDHVSSWDWFIMLLSGSQWRVLQIVLWSTSNI